jgi:hypothetical protein
MSMLNVRLGWWLGNPSVDRGCPYTKDGPTLAVLPLLAEAFGLTTDERNFVYLSDGGHFDNLGLYEMVRRRCRFILVVDAGYDPNFLFQDLGNAVRKISIDLNISIRFFSIENLNGRSGRDTAERDSTDYAVGEIDYRAADGAKENGIILYIKPVYRGKRSVGIRAYKMNQPEFPHQPTVDQSFTESQFESYRALGFEIMGEIVQEARECVECTDDLSVEKFFRTIHKRARAVPKAEDCSDGRYLT